jgi:hypothetical protein
MTVEGFRIDRAAEILVEEQVYKNLVKAPITPSIAEKHRDLLPTH